MNCVSYKNKKNKHIKCNRKAVNNTNYCGYHIKKNNCKIIKSQKSIKDISKKIKNNYKYIYAKIFDKYNYENLMNIYDSFIELPIENIIFLDNKFWDVNLLLEQWGNLLCSTEMQNPFPIFPSNPFTRKNLIKNDVINILNSLIINKIKIYNPLKYLLENYDKIYDNEYITYNTDFILSRKIIKLLEEKFRFRLINNKNSQDCYLGFWTDKNEPLSDFEIFYDYYNKIPFQITNIFGAIIDNIEKTEIKNMLDNYPKEFININN